MTDLEKTRTKPEGQLFAILADARSVMLGLSDHDRRMQPMSPKTSASDRYVWFYTKSSTSLAKAISLKNMAKSQICVMTKEQDYHACINGYLDVENDRSVIERFWSPVVAAWFEHGKDDPELVMLRFDPSDGDVWASSSSAAGFAWEIFKSAVTGNEPDAGIQTQLRFSATRE